MVLELSQIDSRKLKTNSSKLIAQYSSSKNQIKKLAIKFGVVPVSNYNQNHHAEANTKRKRLDKNIKCQVFHFLK